MSIKYIRKEDGQYDCRVCGGTFNTNDDYNCDCFYEEPVIIEEKKRRMIDKVKGIWSNWS